jgi:hypothetical protein
MGVKKGASVAMLKRMAARRAKGKRPKVKPRSIVEQLRDNNDNSAPSAPTESVIDQLLNEAEESTTTLQELTAEAPSAPPESIIDQLRGKDESTALTTEDLVGEPSDELPLPAKNTEELDKLEGQLVVKPPTTDEEALKLAMAVLAEYGDKEPGETLKSLGKRSLKNMIMGVLGPMASSGALTTITGLASFFGLEFVAHIKHQYNRTYGGLGELVSNIFSRRIWNSTDYAKHYVGELLDTTQAMLPLVTAYMTGGMSLFV